MSTRNDTNPGSVRSNRGVGARVKRRTGALVIITALLSAVGIVTAIRWSPREASDHLVTAGHTRAPSEDVAGFSVLEPPKTEAAVEREPAVEARPITQVFRVLVVKADGTPAPRVSVRIGALAGTTDESGVATFDKGSLLGQVLDTLFLVEASDEATYGSALAPVDADEVTVALERASVQAVRGIVIDKDSRAALPRVQVSSGTVTVTTDADGRFALPASPFPPHEVTISRDSRILHHQTIEPLREIRIEVGQPLNATIDLVRPCPENGTVGLYAFFGNGGFLIAEETFTARDSINLTGLPAASSKLVAVFQCPGYSEAQHIILPNTVNTVRLQPTEPLTVKLSAPPQGHVIEVAVQVLKPDDEPLPLTEERTRLSPNGEAVFRSLPAVGHANVFVDATPRYGYGSARILSHYFNLSQRILDLNSVQLYSVSFVLPERPAGSPFELEVELLNSYGPELPNRWMGWGTFYGAQRGLRLLSDVEGRLELALPRCDFEAKAFIPSGSAGHSKNRIDADSAVKLAAGERVPVEIHLSEGAQPLSGRRIRLFASSADGATDSLEVLTNQEGLARTRLYVQPYTYSAEGLHGLVEGVQGRIDVRTERRVDCDLPAPARLLLTNTASDVALVTVLLRGERSLYPLADGIFRTQVCATSLTTDGTILLDPGKYAVIASFGNRSPTELEVELTPGETQILSL